ncbi:MAG TPA: hypothetical protein VG841_09245 [Caulobacterales bacterium]|nr:hypothetical protein [Caulobacterales bacterium]
MIVAALLFPFALQAEAPAASATAPAAHLTGSGEARFRQCVDLIDQGAERAYEEGMAWAAETHEIGGYRCAAMALTAQPGRAAEGARRLESLAVTLNPEATGLRAELFSQAGNAYLLAYDSAHARSAFTRAIATVQSTPEQLPDLLIDRARAYAMEHDYRNAEEDLSHSLDIRANDALALRLRASARMHQNAFELAEADAQAAVNLDPTNVESLVMLGNAKEARRTGQPVDTP